MSTKTATNRAIDSFVCPTCKQPLQRLGDALACPGCSRTYPIESGIPDFVLEDLSKSERLMLRTVNKLRFARIYETRLWYPLVLNVFGGLRSTSLGQLVSEISAMVETVEGRLLDVACGPGTYGRRVASASREVFGIDISMSMLRQGVVYTAREGIDTMYFSRARVESLPFRDEFFDAALCCGSLHGFGDTVAALREIGRTMKPGATLAAMTFTPGGRGILRFRRLRERLRRNQGLYVFGVSEMEGYLHAVGFDNFRPKTFGSILVFCARKCAP